MNALEFLQQILPDTGWIFTATQLSAGGWSNTPHTSIPSAIHHVNNLTFTGRQAYFALATYAEERVWDATWANKDGEIVGKYRQRTQANAQYIRSFFLDLDVDAGDANKFASKAEALKELMAFCKQIGMPRPMVVDSGGGIHAYWPLAHAVLVDEWRPVADKFKNICLYERFKADRSLTSDQARVLRCLGGFNFRRGAPVALLMESKGPYEFQRIAGIINEYATDHDITSPVSKATPKGEAIAGAPAACFEDNLGATNDPVDFAIVARKCAQIGEQAAVRGADIGEKLWRAGLGIAKFCADVDAACLSISDGHAEYSHQAMVDKTTNWRTGPTACSHFHVESPTACESCPHWEKITSPLQLGRTLPASIPPVVITEITPGEVVETEIPPPPTGFSRDNVLGIRFASDTDEEGAPQFDVVCTTDLYPIRVLRQMGEADHVSERSIWRAHMKQVGVVDLEIPSSVLIDVRAMRKFLLEKGINHTPLQSPQLLNYMSAYLQVLADHAKRERMYEHLGWHNDHTAFVLGETVVHRDGSVTPHKPSRPVEAVTKGGLRKSGTLAEWMDAMKFYNQPGYEGHRFFLYASLGAPIFHMNDTGNKGVLLTASGESGRGKTTCLRACASMWGRPEYMIQNGNKDGATANALYDALGTYHSLPFFWDDITEQDPESLRRFLLNISQGKTKERMKGSEHSGISKTWETMVLASANTDDVTRIMTTGKDVSPHLMRMVGVEFKAVDTSAESKIKADTFLRRVNQNYGHVGPVVMAFITKHYDLVAKGYIKNIAMVDRLMNSTDSSAERYWTAAVAAAYTGAQIASKLGLLDYPYEADLKWMVAALTNQRTNIKDNTGTPAEFLADFLDQHLGGTLTLSAIGSTNLDNVAIRPYNGLIIRHETDTKVIYVSRQAITAHCAKMRLPFRALESKLESCGVIVSRNMQKVLGADTQYATGQVRVWKIDADKLSQVTMKGKP